MFIVCTELTINKNLYVAQTNNALLIFWDKVVKVSPQTKNYGSTFSSLDLLIPRINVLPKRPARCLEKSYYN